MKIRTRMPAVSSALRDRPRRSVRSSDRIAGIASDQRIASTTIAMVRANPRRPTTAPTAAWVRSDEASLNAIVPCESVSGVPTRIQPMPRMTAGTISAPAWAVTASYASPTDGRRPSTAASVAAVTSEKPMSAIAMLAPPVIPLTMARSVGGRNASCISCWKRTWSST